MHTAITTIHTPGQPDSARRPSILVVEDSPVHGGLLITTLSEAADVIRGLNAGADGYVTKPYNVQLLLSRLAALLVEPPPRDEAPLEMTVEIDSLFFEVRARGRQVLNLLVSTYSNAVLKNRELLTTQDALNVLNGQLEQKVREKTAALALKIREHADLQSRIESERRRGAERLQETYLGTIQAIALALEKRDPYTSGHQQRPRFFRCRLAEFQLASAAEPKPVDPA